MRIRNRTHRCVVAGQSTQNIRGISTYFFVVAKNLGVILSPRLGFNAIRPKGHFETIPDIRKSEIVLLSIRAGDGRLYGTQLDVSSVKKIPILFLKPYVSIYMPLKESNGLSGNCISRIWYWIGQLSHVFCTQEQVSP
jgi:hypothetical protein